MDWIRLARMLWKVCEAWQGSQVRMFYRSSWKYISLQQWLSNPQRDLTQNGMTPTTKIPSSTCRKLHRTVLRKVAWNCIFECLCDHLHEIAKESYCDVLMANRKDLSSFLPAKRTKFWHLPYNLPRKTFDCWGVDFEDNLKFKQLFISGRAKLYRK